METGVFKTLWRFNAVVIAFTGLAVLCLAVFALYEISKDAFRDQRAINVVNVSTDDPTLETKLVYGAPFRADGQTIVPIEREQSFETRYSNKETSRNVVNYMRVEPDGFSYLFEGNDQLILDRTQLNDPADKDRSDPLGIWMKVVKRDTNVDRRLSRRDRHDVVLLRPDFTDLRVLLEEVSHVSSADWRGNGVFETVAMADGKTRIVTFDATTGTVLTETELPPLALQ